MNEHIGVAPYFRVIAQTLYLLGNHISKTETRTQWLETSAAMDRIAEFCDRVDLRLLYDDKGEKIEKFTLDKTAPFKGIKIFRLDEYLAAFAHLPAAIRICQDENFARQLEVQPELKGKSAAEIITLMSLVEKAVEHTYGRDLHKAVAFAAGNRPYVQTVPARQTGSSSGFQQVGGQRGRPAITPYASAGHHSLAGMTNTDGGPEI